MKRTRLEKFWRKVFVGLVISIVVCLFCTSAKGATWQAMDSNTTAYLRGVWGTSSEDIFAVGDSGIILHYDGDGDNDGSPDNIWEHMPSPTSEVLLDVSGSGPNDVYVASLAESMGVVFQYDGNTWSPLSMPDVPYDMHFEGIWCTSSAKVRQTCL